MYDKSEYTMIKQVEREYITENRDRIPCFVVQLKTPYPAFDYKINDVAEMVNADLGSVFGDLRRQKRQITDQKAKSRTRVDDQLCYVHNTFKVEYIRNYQSKVWEVSIWMHDEFIGGL